VNRPIRCFLIDDDPDDQDVFWMALDELEGKFEVSLAIDGADAMEKFAADSTFVPDYIFIDLNMPRMDGIHCLREIRKLPSLKNSIVTMYSTSSEQKMMEMSLELGANDYIVKPPSLPVLAARLASVFQVQWKNRPVVGKPVVGNR
jgi:DNA-binding response OmpR family regulator